MDDKLNRESIPNTNDLRVTMLENRELLNLWLVDLGFTEVVHGDYETIQDSCDLTWSNDVLLVWFGADFRDPACVRFAYTASRQTEGDDAELIEWQSYPVIWTAIHPEAAIEADTLNTPKAIGRERFTAAVQWLMSLSYDEAAPILRQAAYTIATRLFGDEISRNDDLRRYFERLSVGKESRFDKR